MKLNVVLVEPEIPQNAGNIVRTCAATGAKLHFVKPLGFQITDKTLKRAGLDYWDKLEIEYHESFAEFLEKYKPEENQMYFVTSKGNNIYAEVDYSDLDEVFVLFGKETKGLPEDIMKKYIDKTIRIPMIEGIRCLNLSNAVSIVVYEILKQTGFDHLKTISDKLMK